VKIEALHPRGRRDRVDVFEFGEGHLTSKRLPRLSLHRRISVNIGRIEHLAMNFRRQRFC
jgi:hypothetical protein